MSAYTNAVGNSTVNRSVTLKSVVVVVITVAYKLKVIDINLVGSFGSTARPRLCRKNRGNVVKPSAGSLIPIGSKPLILGKYSVLGSVKLMVVTVNVKALVNCLNSNILNQLKTRINLSK